MPAVIPRSVHYAVALIVFLLPLPVIQRYQLDGAARVGITLGCNHVDRSDTLPEVGKDSLRLVCVSGDHCALDSSGSVPCRSGPLVDRGLTA